MAAGSPSKPRRSGDLSIIPAAAVFDNRLGLADLRVLCALGCFADRAGTCWPATTTLAQDLSVSDRHIRACLRKLEACGHVRTKHRPGQRSLYLIVRKPLDPGSQSSGVELDPGSQSSATPEVRVPGTPEVRVPPNGVNNGTKNGVYAFAGNVIRLSHDDFDKWATAYSHLDLRAELQALDDFYDRELAGAARKNWFQRCSQALNNKNRKAWTERQAANGEADSDTIY